MAGYGGGMLLDTAVNGLAQGELQSSSSPTT